MSPDAPDRVRDLFDRALERAPDTRKSFVKAASGDNNSLFEEVWNLLEAYQDIETRETATGHDELPGQRFGAYQIVRLIGAGGMGRVYLGRRADGTFSRDVAIKVIDSGVQSQELVSRFELERRILGSLRHENIAQLFDAGRSQTGHLYFVMEYVDGAPITEFCNRRNLSLRARIELFTHVCEGVVEAHRSLIVHRDLKPGNILVDSNSTPKLVDFGIAKPLTRAGLESDPTLPLLKRATPAYASPEQMQGDSAHTGMDVFSLGVVLHELVTGHRPWAVEADEMTGTGAGRFVRPSIGLARRLGGSTGHDGITPRDIEGDLDAILLKTLHDDVGHRYSSVDSLLKDLQAYLAGYPVSARAITSADRTRKFVRRNPAFAAMSAVAVIALVIATLSLLRVWYVAARDRDLAIEQLQNLKALASSTFALDVTLADLPGATAQRRQLVEALNEYLSRVHVGSDRALALETAEGHRRLGDIQGNPNGPNLGDAAAALRSYQAAKDLLSPLHGSDSSGEDVTVALMKIEASMGDVFMAQRDYTSAGESYAKALSLAGGLTDQPSNQLSHRVLRAGIHRPLGDLKRATGDVQGALSDYEKALAIDLANTQQFPDEPEHKRLLALTHLRIAGARAAQGNSTDARASYQEATEILNRLASQGYERAGLRREVAFGKARLGAMFEADGNKTGRLEIRAAVEDLRSLTSADPADARARHDLLATLVQLGDAVKLDDVVAARNAYREARDIGLGLVAGQGSDSPAARELAVVDRRLADLANGTAVTDLKLFTVNGGRRVLMQAGDLPPHVKTPIAAAVAVPNGWSRYLLIFGAEGPATLLEERDLTRSDWVVPAAGPPPAQTILLVASPRVLSDHDKRQLLTDVDAIEGPRIVDWDSQIAWTPAAETIESTATARGETSAWVSAVRKGISKLGQVVVTGRTFPLAPGTQD